MRCKSSLSSFAFTSYKHIHTSNPTMICGKKKMLTIQNDYDKSPKTKQPYHKFVFLHL